MDRRYEIQKIWDMSSTKKNGWQKYDNPVVRTAYGDLEKIWKSLTKAMAEHQRDFLMKEITAALNSQSEFRRLQRAAEEYVPQPVGITVWMRQKRYKDDIVLEDEKEVCIKTVGKCTFEGCNDDVHGPRFKYCSSHL